MKTLAVKNRRLGDTVLWTSALDALWQFVGEPLHVACPQAYLPLFESDPRVAKLWPIDSAISMKQLIALRRESFDTTLFFHASRRSQFYSTFISARKSLIHHHSRTKKNLHIIGSGVPQSAIERDLNVLRSLGWKGSAPKTKLFLSKSNQEQGRKLLESFNGVRQNPIVICPTASRPSKCWPFENYVRLIQKLEPNSCVIVVESKDYFSGKETLLARLGNHTPVIETKSLQSLLGLLNCASLFIGSDSGAKHVAAALGIPTITLFGPESIGEWHCYDPSQHRAIQIPVSCRNRDPEPANFAWCSADICPLSSHACMTLIHPEQVYKEVSDLMVTGLK